MASQELIMQPIEQDLERYQTLFNESLHSDNPLLDRALAHLAKRQGKRMRPILVDMILSVGYRVKSNRGKDLQAKSQSFLVNSIIFV